MHDSLTVETNAMKYLRTSRAGSTGENCFGETCTSAGIGTGSPANRCISRAAQNRRMKSDPNIYFLPDVARFAFIETFILTPQIIPRPTCPMHHPLRKLLNWILIENDRNSFQHAESATTLASVDSYRELKPSVGFRVSRRFGFEINIVS